MISLDEYNSMMETMYLLSGRSNADHLHESMRQISEGLVYSVKGEKLHVISCRLHY